MDAKDRLLLAHLQRDARMTAVDLGHRLGLSRSAVQARITRLERDGVITGYTVLLRQKPATEVLRSWLLITMAKDGNSARLLDAMRDVPGVGAIYLLTGELDFIVEAVASTPLGIDDVRKEVAALDGVADIRTHLVLRASEPAQRVPRSAAARFDDAPADEVDS